YKGKRLSKLKRFRQSYINNRLNRDTTLEIKDYNETSFRVQTHDGRRLTKRSFEKIYADSSDQFKKSYKDLVSKDVFWDCVRSVKEVGILPVFDRCVPGTNNFVVNGIVVHNSGAIEQDADIVGFIYRPSDDDVKKDPDLAGVGNFKIAKHRNGALDDIILAVDLAIQKWMDMSEARQYEDSKHPYDQKPYPLYRDPSEPKSLDDDSPF
ncbi:MAG: DnaB-like helicase C-terminal domain-containing protein, partial [Candidatus Saccharimonadales bacterium]